MELLRLGETNLDSYFKNPEPLTQERKKVISGLLDRIEKDNIESEQFPKKLIKIELAEYPTLDLSFLSVNSPYQHNGNQILLPKFGVFKTDGQRVQDFYLTFANLNKFSYRMDVGFSYNSPKFINNIIDLKETFPEAILSCLCDFTEFPKEKRFFCHDYNTYVHSSVPRKIGKKYPQHPTTFKASFSGVFSDEARKKLNEAKSIFGDELYLIAELKPEDWKQKRIFAELLMVGILSENDTAYLIEKTNCNPLVKQL